MLLKILVFMIYIGFPQKLNYMERITDSEDLKISMWVTVIKVAEIRNHSSITQFILLGLTDSPELQILLFWVFAFIYVLALTVNFLLIFIISNFKKLHTPMYFLIFNLSLINILSVSVTIPRLLQSLWTHRKMISFNGCITQVFFIIWALGSELVLLSFMAFDRYAAICHPLHYTIIMRKEVCVGIAIFVWIAGMINTAVHTGLMLHLSFCDSNVIHHFFCDIPPVLDLACSDISINEFMTKVANVVYGMGSCGLTLTSYFFILRTIFRIRSIEGKKKAFSTCSSHLFVISFYFSAIIYTYIRPSSVHSLDKDKLVSLIYSAVTPIVNPLIYSLRNKDFKEGMKVLTGNFRMLSRS
ncbi:olfactory receptor 13G1-like [Erythrolamprus reginae]|uniref:olfactory receptor 13G1-like n=1 Tax=Erythrolamprus reginae TaxID=121349 RepID=UPI00396CF05C